MKTNNILLKTVLLFVLSLILVNSAFALTVSVNDYDPKPAEAGKTVNVWIKVDNQDSDSVSDYSIRMKPKDGLKLSNGEEDTLSVGVIGGKSSSIKMFRLLVDDDAYEGTHTFDIEILRKGQIESTRQLSVEVLERDFNDIELEVGDLDSDPASIKPNDENVKLDIIFQNLGDGTARGVKTRIIDLPEGITLSESYSGTALIGNIESDSQKIASYNIDVDKTVKPGDYTANVEVSYSFKEYDDDTEYSYETVKIPFTITVKPIPLYEIINVEFDREMLSAGDDNVKLKITVKNIGEEKGESVRIKAYGKSEQPFGFDKSSDFVAPILNPGETGQGTLEFDIDDDANLQKYLLDIEIKNLVNDDIVTYDDKVEINVVNPKPNNPLQYVLIVGVCVAVIVFGLKFYFTSKNKMKRRAKKVKSSYDG